MGFINSEGALWRGVSRESQKPTAAYRLGIDVGEASKWEILLTGRFRGS
jgi:hypothetical protein